MPTLIDKEFGEVTIRRLALARNVKLKIGYDGKLVASLPNRAPLRFVQQLIDSSREELRTIVKEKTASVAVRQHGDTLGKSHRLFVQHQDIPQPKHVVGQQQVIVQLPVHSQVQDPGIQRYISDIVKKVLRKEAGSYLPRRVKHIAGSYGFQVNVIRFNNAETRWGSCTSKRSINLNIALMQLPSELIDYVIIHELCHTKHLNHSPAFWRLVGQCCPDYKQLRGQLRQHHPYI